MQKDAEKIRDEICLLLTSGWQIRTSKKYLRIYNGLETSEPRFREGVLGGVRKAIRSLAAGRASRARTVTLSILELLGIAGITAQNLRKLIRKYSLTTTYPPAGN
jgi:hypothetical protein